MAVNIDSFKLAKLEIRYKSKEFGGTVMSKTITIPPKLAHQLAAAGAKRTARKSIKGGEFDTIVVRLNTDSMLDTNGRS